VTVAVFVGVLLVTLAVGAWAGARVRDPRDYYIAGGGVGATLLTGTFLASNVSAALFLGATDVAAQVGYAFWWAYVPTAAGFLLCLGLVGPAVHRLARAHEVLTFPEVLAARFPSRGRALRALAALAIPLLYLPYVAAQLDGVGAVIGRILGVEVTWLGLGPREVGLCIVMAILLVYSLWGGMKAVVWTDLVQMGVLVCGIVLVVPLALSYLGDGDPSAGSRAALDAAPAGAFSVTSAGWPWSVALGQLVWLFAIPAQPHLLTRVLAARDEHAIRRALPWCLLGMLIVYLSTVPIGLVGRALVPELGAGQHYYVEVALLALGPVAAGFALAGVAAAALSTGDTEVVLAGQAVSRDLYQRWTGADASDRRVLRVARIAVLATALVTFVIAWLSPAGIYWMGRISGALFAGGFFAPLLGGVLWSRATGAGALASAVAGLGATLAVALAAAAGARSPVPEFAVGIAVSTVTLVIVSLRTRPSSEELEAACIMRG
jgi:Na+/proline symporter